MIKVESPIRYNSDCTYLGCKEDYNKTTIYPVCNGNYCNCDDFKGYCPVRDN